MTTHLTSVTRLADLDARALDVRPVERGEWATGDYVVTRVTGSARLPYQAEAPSGRLVDVMPGDRVVGALGARAATLQVVGDWRAVEPGGPMELLSMGGVIGRCTSRSPFASRLAPLAYEGHVIRGDRPATMSSFVEPRTTPYTIPTVLIIGSSMDAGKTIAGTQIVRAIERTGRSVAAAKLTGVGRIRDVLALRDAGASPIFDFVDAGLPSTVVPPDSYRSALRTLLSAIEAAAPDVLVAEAGASPLEPYNGEGAMAELSDVVRYMVLCASDPYAVLGVMEAFERTPDLVSGRAVSTSAGAELVERLTGVPALNLADPECRPELEQVLGEVLA